DYLAACVVDLARRTRFHRIDAAVDPRSPKRTLTRLAHVARQARDAATAQGLTVGGVGVALPGLVDPGTGVLLHAPNLGWHDVHVAPLLADALDVDAARVELDNEANLAASAELWFGDGGAWGDYLHVSGEIGVGAGIVRDGALARGSHGFAGEVGHLSIDPRGPVCGCGARGCVERYCGQEAILRAAGVDARPTTSTGRPDGSLARLLAALEAGRVRPARAVGRAGEALGRGVAGAVNVLDVDTVVLGGIYSRLAPWLVGPFTDSLRRNTFAVRWARTRVEVSRLGPDAAVRGAAGLTVHRVLTDPASLSPLVAG
ncbi:MAG: ROK family protein, partial [Streptosporangiales bacterium]|nr:ROK family protein [Streptosporangiales bacterium]